MKNCNPNQVIDLRFQVKHINPKKIQVFDEYRVDPVKAGLIVILIKHREKIISDGINLFQLKI